MFYATIGSPKCLPTNLKGFCSGGVTHRQIEYFDSEWRKCNAPIPHIRKRYYDVYTQGRIPSHIYAKYQYMQEPE